MGSSLEVQGFIAGLVLQVDDSAARLGSLGQVGLGTAMVQRAAPGPADKPIELAIREPRQQGRRQRRPDEPEVHATNTADVPSFVWNPNISSVGDGELVILASTSRYDQSSMVSTSGIEAAPVSILPNALG